MLRNLVKVMVATTAATMAVQFEPRPRQAAEPQAILSQEVTDNLAIRRATYKATAQVVDRVQD